MIEYLAIPYSHPSEQIRSTRFEVANKISAELMKQGRVIFSPISHTHPMCKYELPTDWNYWKAQDEKFLDVCNRLVVVMLDGWKESKGVNAEIDYMINRGVDIEYLDPNNYL